MLNDAPSVSFLLTGSARRNSRALRQLQALTSAGFRCDVWDVDSRGVPTASSFKIHSLHVAHQSGPRFFWASHQSFARALRQSETLRHPQIIHASDLYALPAASSASARTGAALTFDARELYPHVAATVGRPWVSRFWHVLQWRFLPRCDAIFTVNDSIADRIVETYRVPRPTVVQNVPPQHPARNTNLIASCLGINDRLPIVLHQGQIRKHRGCEVLVRAAALVPNARFVFLGDGPLRDHLRELSAELEIDNRVSFMDPVPPDHLLDYTASASVGVTLLEDTCLNHHLALPNKLFEYLMAGIPVVASDLPEIRNVVSGFNVGRLTKPGDVIETAATLRQMLNDPQMMETWRSNTRRVFETINWEAASERFVNVFRTLAEH